jgi:hypothetical protein
MSYLTGETTVPTAAPEPVTSDNPGESMVVRAAEENTAVVYVGGKDITTSTGFPLKPDEWVSITPAHEDELYCIATQAGQKLRWMVAK